jgi:hypothetical protein
MRLHGCLSGGEIDSFNDSQALMQKLSSIGDRQLTAHIHRIGYGVESAVCRENSPSEASDIENIRSGAQQIVVQFGKISHFVRDDKALSCFVISSECEKSFPTRIMPWEPNCATAAAATRSVVISEQRFPPVQQGLCHG